MRAATASGALDAALHWRRRMRHGPKRSRSACFSTALKRDLPLLLDADALNLIATSKKFRHRVVSRRTACYGHHAASHGGRARARLRHGGCPERSVARRGNWKNSLRGRTQRCRHGGRRWSPRHDQRHRQPLLATAGTGDAHAGMIGACWREAIPPQIGAASAPRCMARRPMCARGDVIETQPRSDVIAEPANR